jgi:uncharacterized membrane protein YraQ (UPF0718 family)
MEKQGPISKQAKGDSHSTKGPWIFMGITVLLFLTVYLFDKGKAGEVAIRFYHLALEILPMLAIVFALMVLINLFLKTSTLVKYMGEGSGVKGWLFAIVTGIISVGAIYLWFPILKSMREKGVKPGLIATFLYNRGIKLNWLPLMVLYFGMKYVVVLTMVTVLVSVLQGVIIDLLLIKKTGS